MPLLEKSSLPPLIYHYSGFEAFQSIISSKKLWLTSVNDTNDTTENQWIIPLIDQVFGEILKHNDPRIKDFVNLVAETYKLNASRNVPYIACFCSNGDLLSQWRAYAQDGSGFSLGFSPSKFDIEYDLPMTSIVPSHTVGISSVTYDLENQKNRVRQALANGLALHLGNIEDLGGIIETVATLLGLSRICKHPDFHEEKEWRIIYMPSISTNIFSSNMPPILGKFTEQKFRTTRKGVISTYFEFDFSTSLETSLETVTLGPKNSLELSDVETLLKQEGFAKVKVTKSQIPYQ